MPEKYEFPEELRLITDEPIEDDGWGEFSLNSDESKAELAVRYLTDFVTMNQLLLSPTFDLEKEIARMVKSRICPIDRKRGECPCNQAVIESKKAGNPKCKTFIGKASVRSFDSKNLVVAKEKTEALFKKYREIESNY